MAGSQKEPSTVHPLTDPILAARLEAIKQLAERVCTTGSAPMECVTRELRDMRERRDPKFGVRRSENLELRTSNPRPSRPFR
jgi:hypothetical protein